MMNNKQKLELYLHIPFCVRKCAYCDFLSGPAGTEEITDYVEAMICEIESYKDSYGNYEVSTVFLGGGTPSILTGVQMERVLSSIYDTFNVSPDAEISMEMNPGTVTKEKLEGYQRAGINRISIGLQSVNDEELKLLGRIHTMNDFLQTYEMARKIGFHNINIDLISAIPGQTLESWRQTIKKVTQLKPEHISAYSLIVEEGTPFYEQYAEEENHVPTDKPQLPTEEVEREIYQETVRYLKAAGYDRYEISNYAKPGYECRHNQGYWKRTDYLGIGVGASSLIKNSRFTHIADREAYVRKIREGRWEDIIEEKEALTLQAQMEEYMFLGLRMMKGVSEIRFEQEFGQSMRSIYGEVIDTLLEKSLMKKEGDYLSLTEYGIDISNYVMSQFLL